jgi:RNA polymerase sigma-70 factor (ECF subfamily)
VVGLAEVSGSFDAHAATLILFARQWLDLAGAEDVVQEAFISLMSQRRWPDNLKAWLFKAVRNAAISYARSGSRRVKREMRIAETRGEFFEVRAEDLIDAGAAEEALSRLGADQREVIVMRIWAQMTLKEISEVTGEGVSTLFARYRAGLAEIKRIMETSCLAKKKMS